MVMGYHLWAVSCILKALHRSFHVFIIPFGRVLNRVIAAPVRVSAKSLHFTALRHGSNLDCYLHIQHDHPDICFFRNFASLEASPKTLGFYCQGHIEKMGSFFALELEHLSLVFPFFENDM